ncbi:uncharacterized protein KQ657_000439 [Scheffersomyces spartinae]|uniref:Uncharacterized protein n=1 Tax=Scheffersomyces spartinae TaxID=45513 RepID=A0A9P7VAC0_9ASCO|nr:uncharacterized protein KQ657_000439 [Scheffersomyces spartinae]KAG7193748.1 hypothetical protein KQ657_000439 [Scheffersomyces spartinae]
MSLLIPLVVVGTLISGAGNSLLTKFQDNQCVKHCSNPDPTKHLKFEQPALQTLQMFVGELAVYLIYHLVYKSLFSNRNGYTAVLESGEEVQDIHPGRNIGLFASLKFALPSTCDLCATTLMNLGLIYTPVSVYQMTRGSLVLFVAIMSVIFLKRHITKLEWVSLGLVTLGVAVVGYSGSQHSGKKTESTTIVVGEDSAALVVFGISLIVIAEICQAVQFVSEEHILKEYPLVPLQLVYFEGFYGVTILTFVMIVLTVILGITLPTKQFEKSPFNLPEALSQMGSSPAVLFSSILIMISIASFNYCGMTLTHQILATSRSTVDTCRTLIVWVLAMFMGWESFHFLQFIGFAILVFGTLCFNGVLEPEKWSYVPGVLKETPNERLIDTIDEQIDRM